MPLNIPDRLPAIEILKAENIFVMSGTRAQQQDIRPLRIVVLNLMPIKVTTETDLVRLLSNTPLQIDITFMKLRSHTPRHTPVEHMMMFYKDFELLRPQKFDGMIITGAPVELLPFDEVGYWQEICDVFRWADTHVTSTMYICWAAQAGLHFHYGVEKHALREKMFGVFEQRINDPLMPLFRGFDDTFHMPHSRHTGVWREDIAAHPELTIAAESPQSGVSIVVARGGRQVFVMGHMEYVADTLHKEYVRDLGTRDDVPLPTGYYRDDDPTRPPVVTWRAHANLLFSNWINYYVYQLTPYDINTIA